MDPSFENLRGEGRGKRFEEREERFRRAAPKFFVPTLRVQVLGKDHREYEIKREYEKRRERDLDLLTSIL
jgi:hypothetical protein